MYGGQCYAADYASRLQIEITCSVDCDSKERLQQDTFFLFFLSENTDPNSMKYVWTKILFDVQPN